MKQIVMIFSTLFFGGLTLIVVMTLYGDMNRSMELQSSLSSFVETALEKDMVSGRYQKEEAELFIRDFAKKLAVSWENDADMLIEVMQYEPELGILSLKVTASYERLFGKIGTVECERAVILNKIR